MMAIIVPNKLYIISVYKPHTTHNSLIRSDEGLTLETSASESLYGGQFKLSTQLIKPNYLVILPPTQHHSFFRNLPPLNYEHRPDLLELAHLYQDHSISLVVSSSRFMEGVKRLVDSTNLELVCEKFYFFPFL